VNWYVLKETSTEGPYSDEQLGELVGRNLLKPDDLIWKPGHPKWTLAIDIPGLFSRHAKSMQLSVLPEKSTFVAKKHFRWNHWIIPFLCFLPLSSRQTKGRVGSDQIE
jgi:hypothetical protein